MINALKPLKPSVIKFGLFFRRFFYCALNSICLFDTRSFKTSRRKFWFLNNLDIVAGGRCTDIVFKSGKNKIGVNCNYDMNREKYF